MSQQDMTILTELKRLLMQYFGNQINKVTLFGSRSRDTAREDSDYDILVVLNEDFDWKKEREIIDACYEIDLKYDVLTDVKVVSLPEIRTLKGKQPYILHALQEGVTL